ncbi:dihydrodipicolinate synthetase [Purpureocillium lavendulum]|uniref:Dihydrodipicolinate synthetase n=1 Tax=Purpureocillium lavendulum TaxID=1247861 RepID=A0AB34FTQ7_9HYPO|nr:dihydrodipicolinate synthetase [Purpureocillium lavendulum]
MAPHSTALAPGTAEDSPPAYNAANPAGGAAPDDVDLAASFATLSLGDEPADPDTDTCLAHLKFLHAIQSMKEDVGYTDGLWGIWDSRAENPLEDLFSGDDAGADGDKPRPTGDDRVKAALSRIREKRWALFVARAVDRYEAWWHALPKEAMLTEQDMEQENNPRYSRLPSTGTFLAWKEHMLPPLDVLMVFHSHMLNPRAFLEDCMRHGMGTVWTAGMPWRLVSDAIDTRFNYTVTDDAKARWTQTTNRPWANQGDATHKPLRCAFCKHTISVPWTTCGKGEKDKTDILPGLNYKEVLSVSKFVQDSALLLSHSVPMPGTILEPQTGRPERVPAYPDSLVFPRTFPNRMIRLDLRIKIMELLRPDGDMHPTMERVRDLVEGVVASEDRVRKIDSASTVWGRYKPRFKAKVSVRQMMNRYWENFSPFALDLGGAVIRQGVFIDKMIKLDWLHAPSARATMQRLMNKYKRFIWIMRSHPTNVAVPTLDVDLAWHTHQLSPFAYYRYTVELCSKFIDHNDKMDETKLSASFEWTSKKYQEMFSEIYSECTCWYCETLRSGMVSSVGKLLGTSKDEKIAENFYKSGAAKLCPPDNSAHISAHNAVRSVETAQRERVTNYLRARHQEKLDRNYERAVKRAQKKGRELPPKEEYYNHWGYNYYMYSPFMFPYYYTPGLYYGWDPCYVLEAVEALVPVAAEQPVVPVVVVRQEAAEVVEAAAAAAAAVVAAVVVVEAAVVEEEVEVSLVPCPYALFMTDEFNRLLIPQLTIIVVGPAVRIESQSGRSREAVYCNES